MKQDRPTFIGCRAALLAVTIIGAGLLDAAYCQTDSSALLLQQTPAHGGSIDPDPGIHYFDINTDVNLTAAPSRGYQFIYWLGDVSEPTSSRTVVYLDAPKIVIAVFERLEHEFVPVQQNLQSAALGGSIASRADNLRRGLSAAGGGIHPKSTGLKPVQSQYEDEVPSSTPEPATAILLILGSFFVLTRRRDKRTA